jgi:hypothetical protein
VYFARVRWAHLAIAKPTIQSESLKQRWINIYLSHRRGTVARYVVDHLHHHAHQRTVVHVNVSQALMGD